MTYELPLTKRELHLINILIYFTGLILTPIVLSLSRGLEDEINTSFILPVNAIMLSLHTVFLIVLWVSNERWKFKELNKEV